MQAADFVRIADLLHRGVAITKAIQSEMPAGSKIKDLQTYLAAEGKKRADLSSLASEVEVWSSSFPMPGL
jgi:hypothetical protein